MPSNWRATRLPGLACFACLLTSLGCSDPSLPSRSEAPPGRLATESSQPVGESQDAVSLGSGNEPKVIDLGSVPISSSHDRKVLLSNTTADAIRIDRFETSCECTSVEGLPVEIPPGGTKEITVRTDLGKEPNFTGGLAIRGELRSGAHIKGIVEVRCDVMKEADEKPAAAPSPQAD